MMNLEVMNNYQKEMETIELRQRKLEELKTKINLDNKRLTERFVKSCDEMLFLLMKIEILLKYFIVVEGCLII